MINRKPAIFLLAALLGGAAYVPSQAQSQAAAGLSTPSSSVGGASSIIGPIDALFAKCKDFDPSRLAQYQEAERVAYERSNAEELRIVRSSPVYAATVEKMSRRIDETATDRKMKACDGLLAAPKHAK